MGLLPILNRHIKEFSEGTGIAVEFVATGMKEIDLDLDTAISLYRIVQEAFDNI